MILTAILAFAGCGSSEESGAGPGACADVLQYDGETYAARAETDESPTRVGDSLRGTCSDVDPADGVEFDEGSESVEVGSLGKFPPSEVLGAKGADGRTYIYVAEDVPEDRALEIERQLR